MSGSVAERAGAAAVELASVRLSVVLHELQIVFLAEFADPVRICALTVEMDYQDCPCPVSDCGPGLPLSCQ